MPNELIPITEEMIEDYKSMSAPIVYVYNEHGDKVDEWNDLNIKKIDEWNKKVDEHGNSKEKP